MKKILSVILSLLIIIAAVPMSVLCVSAATKGTTGDCQWSLDGTVLTISGNGDMGDYDLMNAAPWGESVTDVIISSGVTSVGNYAFKGLSSLKSVIMPDSVTQMGAFSFSGCSSLESIRIPDGVTAIEFGQFSDCVALKSIELPASVTYISLDAFKDCTSLNDISISGNIERVYSSSFSNTGYYNNDDNWTSDALYIGKCLINTKSDISGRYEIKDGTLVIADGAFSGRISLTEVIIPDSIKRISSGAFYNCEALISVDIPRSVTKIESSAFARCQSLADIALPDSVTQIGESAFYRTDYYNNEDNWENGVLYIGKHLINAKADLSGEYTVKEGTLCVADYSFLECENLTNVVLANSVTAIGYGAFRSCISLADISIPQNVKSIDCRAFTKCSSLERISVASDNASFCDIDGVLYNKDKTAVIKYPEGKTDVSYTVADTTEKIDDWAFSYSEYLEEVILNKKLTEIGNYGFAFSSALKSISIPDRVKTIGHWAFNSCSSLSTLTLGSGVEKIGSYAFDDCDSISSVSYGGTVKMFEKLSKNILDGNRDLLNEDIECAEFFRGDINDDGEVSTSDLAFSKLMLAGVNEKNDVALLAGDLNDDGEVNTTDLAALKLMLAEIV